jgi:hypothetical protein
MKQVVFGFMQHRVSRIHDDPVCYCKQKNESPLVDLSGRPQDREERDKLNAGNRQIQPPGDCEIGAIHRAPSGWRQ